MLKKRLLSFKYAFAGIRTLILTQPNVIIHLIAMVLVIAMGFFFAISTTEWCLIIFAIAMVLTAEAFNTSLEFLTDLVSPDYHELAEKTKDVAAGAVLIAAFGAATVGGIVFLPKLIQLFR